jgi:hypothetical protein
MPAPLELALSNSSSAAANGQASSGFWGGSLGSTIAPTYHKNSIDLSNPYQLLGAAGLVLLVIWAWKKKGR